MHPDIIAKLLLLSLVDRVDKGLGPLVVSKQLLETPLSIYVVLDDQTDPDVISASTKSGEVLTGIVDNEMVKVIV